MLLNFLAQTINNYHVPPFSVNESELVVIRLPNDEIGSQIKFIMIEMITRKVKNENIEVSALFQYASHFLENRFKSTFSPTTVGEYIKKNARRTNPICEAIFKTDKIRPETKVKTLQGNSSRLLSVSVMLSQTNHILFDLVGVDPQGRVKIYEIVKNEVKVGGAAILFDFHDTFQNNCSKFIKVKCSEEDGIDKLGFTIKKRF